MKLVCVRKVIIIMLRESELDILIPKDTFTVMIMTIPIPMITDIILIHTLTILWDQNPLSRKVRRGTIKCGLSS